MARKSKFEEEKNKLESVKRFLEVAKSDAERLQFDAGAEQLYEKAAMLKSFKDVLQNAIKLCQVAQHSA